MYVNGKEISVQNKISLYEFLNKEGYEIQRVAVEKNGNIVPRKSYETEVLSDKDKLEIVCFVGGG
ncbi:MAG: sulfur carrier protein ThiS [Spirochaetes bacterium]|nr:sulfur carrier protein ThiS [Spirochaetota bacterium]